MLRATEKVGGGAQGRVRRPGYVGHWHITEWCTTNQRVADRRLLLVLLLLLGGCWANAGRPGKTATPLAPLCCCPPSGSLRCRHNHVLHTAPMCAFGMCT
jgi:hypothetical protein